MKRFSISLFVIVLGLVFSISIVYADMAKEGSGNYRSAKSIKREVLAMGKDYMQVNMSQLGMVVDAPKNSPFENATFKALVNSYIVKGKFEGSGFIEWVCPSGDKIYGRTDFTGEMGKGYQSTVEIVGGTGACEGIQGMVEIRRGPQVKSAQEGMRQAFSVGKVNWKVP